MQILLLLPLNSTRYFVARAREQGAAAIKECEKHQKLKFDLRGHSYFPFEIRQKSPFLDKYFLLSLSQRIGERNGWPFVICVSQFCVDRPIIETAIHRYPS
jgi:hypothetical protein